MSLNTTFCNALWVLGSGLNGAVYAEPLFKLCDYVEPFLESADPETYIQAVHYGMACATIFGATAEFTHLVSVPFWQGHCEAALAKNAENEALWLAYITMLHQQGSLEQLSIAAADFLDIFEDSGLLSVALVSDLHDFAVAQLQQETAPTPGFAAPLQSASTDEVAGDPESSVVLAMTASI